MWGLTGERGSSMSYMLDKGIRSIFLIIKLINKLTKAIRTLSNNFYYPFLHFIYSNTKIFKKNKIKTINYFKRKRSIYKGLKWVSRSKWFKFNIFSQMNFLFKRFSLQLLIMSFNTTIVKLLGFIYFFVIVFNHLFICFRINRRFSKRLLSSSLLSFYNYFRLLIFTRIIWDSFIFI